ncbi:MAG: GGDEF domain-containing protein, partial [Longimicrobiales bacterium]|nr:GGDEF domain-containing protein [Longimicrobiales bacterium]
DSLMRALADAAAPRVGLVRRVITRAPGLGGEEFVALLPETDGRGALRLAEAMRSDVEVSFARLARELDRGPHLTASFGCATLVPAAGMVPAQLIRIADERLYLAKSRGRNRVEPHSVD